MTLVEVLITFLLFMMVSAGVMMFISAAMRSLQETGESLTAVTHIENIFEQIKISTINFDTTNWPQWAINQGYNTLPNEQFTVTRSREDSVNLPKLWTIRVQDTWRCHGGLRAYDLTTKVVHD